MISWGEIEVGKTFFYFEEAYEAMLKRMEEIDD